MYPSVRGGGGCVGGGDRSYIRRRVSFQTPYLEIET